MAQNWFYDIGTGYGTGETEQTTNSTSNVYLDGNGHLVLKATDNGGTLDEWQDRVHPRRLPGLGLRARDDRGDRAAEPANGLGHAAGLLRSARRCARAAATPQSGEIDMMRTSMPGTPRPRRCTTRLLQQRSRADRLPEHGSTCQTGYHTYSVIVDRTNTSAETLQAPDGRDGVHHHRGLVGTAAWQAAIDHGFFIIFGTRRMGGNYPNGPATAPPRPPPPPRALRRASATPTSKAQDLHAAWRRRPRQARPTAWRELPDQPELARRREQPDLPVRLQRLGGDSSGRRTPTARSRPKAAALTWCPRARPVAPTWTGTRVPGTAAQVAGRTSPTVSWSTRALDCASRTRGGAGSRLTPSRPGTGATDQQWTLPTRGRHRTGGSCGTTNVALNC